MLPARWCAMICCSGTCSNEKDVPEEVVAFLRSGQPSLVPAPASDEAAPVSEPAPVNEKADEVRDVSEAVAAEPEPKPKGPPVAEDTDQVAGANADRHNELEVNVPPLASQGLGIELEARLSGALIVLAIKDGPIADWNQAHPESRVEHADRLFSVNGVAVCRDTLDAAFSPNTHAIVCFRKPVLASLDFERTSAEDRLGMDVMSFAGQSLQVRRIQDGLVSRWNAQHRGEEVEAGDLILNVNGCSGDSAEMIQATKEPRNLHIVVARRSYAA